MPTCIDPVRLKSERHARGWTQEHLAVASGLSARTVQRLERGAKASADTLMALASALDISIGALASPIGPVRRTTPLTILPDIACWINRYRQMGFEVIETDDPGCVGVKGGKGVQILCSQMFMLGDYPAEYIEPLVGRTIPYIWVNSLETAASAWSRVVCTVMARAGTKEALVEDGGQWAILAETLD